MSRFNGLGSNMKIFIREQSGGGNDNDPRTAPGKYYRANSLTGEKAKMFYEEVISTPPVEVYRKSLSKPKESISTGLVGKTLKKKDNKIMFKNKDLLVMGQNNDVKNLELFFSQNDEFDIDIVDDFGWTPLMCASCSGAEGAVQLLLEKGADPKKTDKFGNTPLKLAKLKNFKTITEILENAGSFKSLGNKDEDKIQSPEPYYCELCEFEFKAAKRNHETSTLHVFNCKHKSSIFYGIPESNKGFQLLLKEGWNKGEGLGPKGSGRKFPIKAAPKKNRKGIGLPDRETKIRSTLTDSVKLETKKLKMYSKRQEKEFEKNFRLEFS